MSDSIKTFWKRLSASQLLSSSQIESARRKIEQAEDKGKEIDARAIAKALLRGDLLTPFQAKVLLKGLKLPLVWGEYHLLEPIEDGPFAHYYDALHVPTGHRLALRLISAADWPTACDPLQVQRDIQTFRVVGQGNVVRTYELIEHEKWFAFAMDRVKGQRLSERLQANNRLSSSEAASCIYQVTQALIAWHDSGLTHGDIQPASIMENHDGLVQLWRDPLYLQVPFYGASGAPLADLQDRAAYLAPELSVLRADFGPLTDIYALGCTFFELLSGHPPFQGTTLMDVMKQHAERRIDSLSELGVEQPIEQIVIYMMAKRPQLRYQTAEAVGEQIANYTGNQLAVAPPAPQPATQVDFEKWLANKPRVSAPTPTTDSSPIQSTPSPMIVGDEAAASTHNSPLKIIEARKRAKRRQRMALLAGLSIVVLAAMVGGVGFMLGGDQWFKGPTDEQEIADSTDNNPDGGSDKGGSSTEGVAFDETAATPQLIVTDDGKALWESPTQGPPIELKQIPNAPRLLLLIRPADLLSTSQGPLILNALGPAFGEAIQQWQQELGIALDQIQHLTISLHDDSSGQGYRPFYRVELVEPRPLSQLESSWNQLPGASSLDGLLLKSDSADIWVCEQARDDADSVQTFVLGASDLVAQAQERGQSPPTMQPDLRSVTQSVDQDRHFNFVFLSSNLTNPNSRQWMSGAWSPLWQPLQPILLGGIQAGCFSAHVDTDLYLELSVKGQISQTPEQMAGYLEGQLPNWQNQIEEGIAGLPANSYWEKVRLRYVSWVRELISLTRVGVEYRLAKANVWLPGPAAHNLLAGSELALATVAGPITAVVETGADGSAPESMEELLASEFEFSVTSNDMINVMSELQVAVGEKFKSLPFEFEIRLMGNDLREEGITQNQRISNFSMSETPLAEILTGLVVTANPDKASESPKDDKQKLLWVAVQDPDDPSRTIILITTRKAALRNSYPLHEVFGGDAS